MIKYLYFEYTILGLSQESVVCSVHALGIIYVIILVVSGVNGDGIYCF